MTDFADELAAQARQLWAHLPAGLVPGDDESLHFKTDQDGSLFVRVDRTGDVYTLKGGLAWHLRYLESGVVEVSCYQNGDLAERRTLRRAEAMAMTGVTLN